jgi:hypothetical protein
MTFRLHFYENKLVHYKQDLDYVLYKDHISDYELRSIIHLKDKIKHINRIIATILSSIYFVKYMEETNVNVEIVKKYCI